MEEVKRGFEGNLFKVEIIGNPEIVLVSTNHDNVEIFFKQIVFKLKYVVTVKEKIQEKIIEKYEDEITETIDIMSEDIILFNANEILDKLNKNFHERADIIIYFFEMLEEELEKALEKGISITTELV